MTETMVRHHHKSITSENMILRTQKRFAGPHRIIALCCDVTAMLKHMDLAVQRLTWCWMLCRAMLLHEWLRASQPCFRLLHLQSPPSPLLVAASSHLQDICWHLLPHLPAHLPPLQQALPMHLPAPHQAQQVLPVQLPPQ